MNEYKKLEILLNKLIELGWQPWGINCKRIKHNGIQGRCYIGGWQDEEVRSINDLVSIDSGLWDFVEEKKLHEDTDESIKIDDREHIGFSSYGTKYYFLMHSAIQEDKVEYILKHIQVK